MMSLRSMVTVGKDILFRQSIEKVMVCGEAREGAQILGIGPQHLMSDAAFIAAGSDESCVIEMGHGHHSIRIRRIWSSLRETTMGPDFL